MWLLTEWQHFNAQFEAEEKRALKFRDYITLNEKLSLKNISLEDIEEFAKNKTPQQTVIDFITERQDPPNATGATQKYNENPHLTSDRYNPSTTTVDGAEGNDADDDKNIVDDEFEPEDTMTSKAVFYRVGLGIILIVGSVCLLSMPEVPERFLGIRSPQRVLMEYRLTPHPGNDSVLHPVEVNQTHSIHKRHAIRVPHKFWAKARPHNKFKKKKRNIHHQLQPPPEVPGGPVPNPHLINRKH